MRALGLFAALALAAPAAAAPAGWQFHQGRAGMPAILLIHGLAASATHWTDPAATWSIKDAHFDHRRAVKDREGSKDFKTVLGKKVYAVKAGIESVRLSPLDDDAGAQGSFWTYLVGKGYSVATWNQVPCMDSAKLPDQACKDQDTFENAYASAKEALAELARVSGDAPIALLGHSRGGLIARALLKEAGLPGRERVKWLITLHSPNQGSSMATLGVGLQKKLGGFEDALDLDFLPKALRPDAKHLLGGVGDGLNGSIDALVAITGMEGARELAKNGAVIKALEQGESKPAGVTVLTFGGTSPRVAEAYLFLYDRDSADPRQRSWHADKHKILDFPDTMGVGFDEMKAGGDLLVTDQASHLPWEDRHISHALNHAEVLWSRAVQDEVDAALRTQAPPNLGIPPKAGNSGVFKKP